MTQREKVLASLVGGLLVILVLFFGWTKIQAGFEEKNNTLGSLQMKVTNNQNSITQGLMAKKSLDELAVRSLPSDMESAKNIYLEWLIKFSEKMKLNQPKPKWVGETVSKSKAYHELRYTLDGDARLDDVVALMYEFYKFPYLHKITNLRVAHKEKSDDYGMMTIKLQISVAVLNNASRDQATPKPENFKLMQRPLQDYETAIIQRNIFFPANKPPAWSKTASTNANKGSEMSYELEAKDPDAKQKIKYEIVDSEAEGARIRDDKLQWKPKANGEFSVTVRATDSGLPSTSSTQKIVIKVTDPPKEKIVQAPKFDVATQTRVTALVSGKSGPEAWFLSRTDGKRVSVHVGDKFDLAGITGTVTAIGSSFVEIESDGRRWIIGQDETLADAYKRSQVD
jgi:hypothetical protein